MVSDSTLQLTFKKLPPVKFWHKIKDYSQLSEKAIKLLLLFPTTYLCKAGFSSFNSAKTTLCNKLKTEADRKIQLSAIMPEICKNIEQFILFKNIFLFGKI